MNEVAACKSVLMEVLTILGKDLDKLAVVGGWVPELVFPNRGHIGSLDVDLALDARKLKPMAYESIRKKLVDSAYQQAPDMPNRFFRLIENTTHEIKVDFITGEFADIAAEGTHIPIQEMPVWKARGVDLAFEFQQEVSIEGLLPGGEHNRLTVRLPAIGAYVCIKAITLSERMKRKDAYDIYFCIDNYTGGYKALAAEFHAMQANPLVAQAISILRDKFFQLDSIGPVWAAQTAEEATPGTGTNLETEQRRAFELVNSLLRTVEQPQKS
jgi:hypothetical protein